MGNTQYSCTVVHVSESLPLMYRMYRPVLRYLLCSNLKTPQLSKAHRRRQPAWFLTTLARASPGMAPKRSKNAGAGGRARNVPKETVLGPVRALSKRAQSANAGKARVTLQSLGLANVKKEVADMSPLQVARQVSNLIVETALSILSGKGARFGSKPWQRCPQLMYDVLQVSATRSRAARRLIQCTLRRLVALSSKVRRVQLRFITQLKTCAHCRQTRRQSGYLATRPPSGRQPSQRV